MRHKCIKKEDCKNRVIIYLKNPERMVNKKTGHKWDKHKSIFACLKGDDYYECEAE